MASENIEDWNLPVPTQKERSKDSDDGLSNDKRLHNKDLQKLKDNVQLMAYKPVKPKQSSPRNELLAKPKKMYLIENAKHFSEFMVPLERGERLKCLAAKQDKITVEQLERVIRAEKAKERQKEDILKRKQEVYYELLTKLELQCRTQYLNVVLEKFANFLAKLATTMRIPTTLMDPYVCMHRGIFYNILQSIGVEPTSQSSVYSNTTEDSEYEVCHKLSHALLSLIIKALDLASTRNPNDIRPMDADFKMDNGIKERLMSAAQKKVLGTKHLKCKQLLEPNI